MNEDTQPSTFIITREDLTGIARDDLTITANIRLVADGLRIGRSPDCELRLNHPAVSSVHAGIREKQGRFLVSNLSPSGAVIVNKRAVLFGEDVVVADGDVMLIGPFRLHLQRDGRVLQVRVSLAAAPPAGEIRERAAASPIATASIATPSCLRCGSPVPNGATFCGRCGSRVVAAAKSAPPRGDAAPEMTGATSAAGGRPPTPQPASVSAPSGAASASQRDKVAEVRQAVVEKLSAPMLNSSPRDEEFNARVPRPPQSFVKNIGQKLRTLARQARRTADCDPVDCTAFSPPAVKRGETFMVQVFAHRPEQTRDAQELAKEFDAETARRGFASLEAEIRRGAKLTVHLSLPDFRVADPVQSLTWRGRPESVQFAVSAPARTSSETFIGTVNVSEDGVPLGHVKFKISVAEAGEIPRANISAGEAARRYRKAFISYATQDRAEVLKRVQMLARLKIKFFQDVLDLEPGARWEQQLYRHIDESDLFLLFWSRAAQRSEWVLNEVRYALARKRDDETQPPEIIPVIIEGPPPVAPPPELAHLHFNDYLVYFMAPPGA